MMFRTFQPACACLESRVIEHMSLDWLPKVFRGKAGNQRTIRIWMGLVVRSKLNARDGNQSHYIQGTSQFGRLSSSRHRILCIVEIKGAPVGLWLRPLLFPLTYDNANGDTDSQPNKEPDDSNHQRLGPYSNAHLRFLAFLIFGQSSGRDHIRAVQFWNQTIHSTFLNGLKIRTWKRTIKFGHIWSNFFNR